MSPALAGIFFTTEPPRTAPNDCLSQDSELESMSQSFLGDVPTHLDHTPGSGSTYQKQYPSWCLENDL